MNIEIIDKIYERKLNWYDGKLYCELLTIDGKNDWRLPTIEELVDISYDTNNFKPACYWSSSIVGINDRGLAMYREFSKNAFMGYNNFSANYYIRPVRTI